MFISLKYSQCMNDASAVILMVYLNTMNVHLASVCVIRDIHWSPEMLCRQNHQKVSQLPAQAYWSAVRRWRRSIYSITAVVYRTVSTITNCILWELTYDVTRQKVKGQHCQRWNPRAISASPLSYGSCPLVTVQHWDLTILRILIFKYLQNVH